MELKKLINKSEKLSTLRMQAIGLVAVAFLSIASPAVAGQSRVPVDQDGLAALHMLPEGIGIDGQYIVALHDQDNSAIQNILDTYGIESIHEYEQIMDGFAARLTAEQIDALRQDERVSHLQQDGIVTGTNEQGTQLDPPWNIDLSDNATPEKLFDNAYEYTATGQGMTIAVLDSGVAEHSEFISADGQSRITSRVNMLSSQNPDNCHFHGTHVAGIAAGNKYGIAKESSIASVQVLNCGNSGSIGGVIGGMDWILNNLQPETTVVNMSLIVEGSSLEEGVQKLIDAGFIVVAAAGNGAVDACNSTPSGVRDAITVGGIQWFYTTPDVLEFYSKSNRGSCVDILAPARPIESAAHDNFDGTIIAEGTSMAAPHVAGFAAGYRQYNPDATTAEIEAYIHKTAVSITTGVPTDTINLSLQTDTLDTGIERGPLIDNTRTITYHTHLTPTGGLTIQSTFDKEVQIGGDAVITTTIPATTTEGGFYCDNEKGSCIYMVAPDEALQETLSLSITASPGQRVSIDTVWQTPVDDEKDRKEVTLAYGNFIYLPVIRR